MVVQCILYYSHYIHVRNNAYNIHILLRTISSKTRKKIMTGDGRALLYIIIYDISL